MQVPTWNPGSRGLTVSLGPQEPPWASGASWCWDVPGAQVHWSPAGAWGRRGCLQVLGPGSAETHREPLRLQELAWCWGDPTLGALR